MRKAVFFDIDGTLWDEHMRIPKSTIEAVKALREAGHYTFICSGRSRSNIRSEKLLGIGFDGVVAACGAHIEIHGEKVYEQILSPRQVAHALDVIKRHGMSVVLEGPRYLYVNESEFLEDPYVIYLRKELGEDIKSIEENSDFEINKMSANLNGADLTKVIEELGAVYDVIIHGEDLIEIIPKGYSKAMGIEKICDMLGIDPKDTYAFGDSANDIEMLRAVGHGIAMGNGTREAKGAAEYVTTDIMEDGIKNGLLHYGLIAP